MNTNKNSFKNEDYRFIKPLKPNTISNHIFYSNKYVQKIREELNNQNVKSSNFPIEHRIYPINSKGMEWHIDTLMYDIPQYEAVFTIRNNSRSYTEWEDNNGKIHRKWTKPNSILIVRAKGYKHRVTPPKTGEREILKLIYTQSDKPNDNYYREMKRFNNI